LKRAKESDASSRRWFQAWWKNNELHRIKIKSLAIVRYFAAQMSDVKQWFVNYRNILQELNIIRSRNIWNFDEVDFRVNCMQKRNILMSKNISDFYSISFENRKFLIIIEDVTSAKPETGWGRRKPAPAAQPRQPSQPQSQLSETRKRLSIDNSQMINFWYHFWLFWNKSKIW
jgi:hypothetical protein